MKIDTVVLNFGYVESTRLATLLATNAHKTFASEEEATKDLAEDLLAKFKDKFMKRMTYGACCKKSKKDATNAFCNKCGKDLNISFRPWEFKEWLQEILQYDLDSWGYDEEADGRELTWEIGGDPCILMDKKQNQVASVCPEAEKVLMEALGLDPDE